ncbi:MAG: ATP phosphoribosyltransferase [Myxococcales bacterium]|nr:ATP phosphoribosyltransferase [Myxococcales bacterium]
MAEPLTFALPKGRILDQAAPLFARAGLDLAEVSAGDRRLQLELPGGSRLLLVKPADVHTYVNHGIADLGVAGGDTLHEAEDADKEHLYEPLDLGIGACRLVVAEPCRALVRRGAPLRVATKYPRTAQRHYRARGIQPVIIPLHGSVELGPVTGLSDQIVDLVESGETLRQNDLREVATILHVTSRLIVHQASLKLKHDAVAPVIAALRDAVAAGGPRSQ